MHYSTAMATRDYGIGTGLIVRVVIDFLVPFAVDEPLEI